MHGKVTKGRNGTILKYASDASHALDDRLVSVFAQGVPPILLDFSVTSDRLSSAKVSYDITRLITLPEHVASLSGLNSLRMLFMQVKQLLEVCMELRLPLMNLEMDTSRAYYDSWANTLKFVYLPFTGISPNVMKVRDFLAGITRYVRDPDSESMQLVSAYDDYFASHTQFNPVGIIDFLDTVCGSGTQVDWSAVRTNQRIRKADSTTTMLGTGSMSWPSPSGRAEDAPRETGVHSAGSVDEPITGEGESDDVVKGLHARIDPGTTVLGNLPFDLHTGEGELLDCSDGTTVLDSAENLSSGEGDTPTGGRRAIVIDLALSSSSSNGKASEEVGLGDKREPLSEGHEVSGADLESALSPTRTARHMRRKQVAKRREEAEKAATGETPSGDEGVRGNMMPVAGGEGVPPSTESSVESASAPERDDSEKEFWLRRRSTGERARITGSRFVVGKSKYSTFQVRDTTTVSRSHAIFTVEAGSCWIEDDGSRNGTYLNNRRIEPHARELLADGMVIRMSNEEFEFSESEGER